MKFSWEKGEQALNLMHIKKLFKNNRLLIAAYDKAKIFRKIINTAIRKAKNSVSIFFIILIVIFRKVLSLSKFFYPKDEKYTIGLDARLLHRQLSGAERYIIQLVLNLSKIDSRNNYIILSTGKLDNINLPNNFKIKILSTPGDSALSLRDYFYLSLKKMDLYHLTWSIADIRHYLLLPLADTSVVFIHDLILLLFPDYLSSNLRIRYKRLLQLSSSWASQVMVQSEYTKKDLIKHLNIPAEKINVTYLAADERFKVIDDRDIKKKVMVKYDLLPDFIFSLGKDYPHKNIISLIRAYHKLVEEKGIKHNLLLAGESVWKSSKDEIQKYVDNSNLGQRVRWLGHVDDEDLPVLFNLATVFVFPSLYEGFGLPLLEAMACGTPVIAINTTSIPEVVGDAGILVNAYDIVDGLANSTYKVLIDELLRKELIEKGLERAKYFSWERTAEQTLSVYYKALGNL